MEIVENLAEWEEAYRTGWLAHYEKTGETKWDIYNRPNNREAPSGSGINLSQSRLVLISTAGAYLRDGQPAFDDENDLGDYTTRLFPSTTPFAEIAFAHTHYDHAAVDEDPQVLLPLHHLVDMVAEGKIGSLAANVISYCGYQPDIGRIVRELTPTVIAAVKTEQAQAALLVPAWPLCSQSVGLVARALEMAGIATTLTSWNAGRTRITAPPRATFTELNRGATLGQPHNGAQQRRVLEATLALLAEDAPLNPIRLDEKVWSKRRL